MIEQDAFEKLPSISYARGFVRIYARELGLDGWSLLKRLNRTVPEEHLDRLELQPEDLESIPKRSHPPLATSQGIGLMVIIAVLGVALLIGGLKLYEIWPELFPKESEVAAQETELIESLENANSAGKAEPVVEGGIPKAVPLANPLPAEPIKPGANEPPKALPVAVPVAAPTAEAGATAVAFMPQSSLRRMRESSSSASGEISSSLPAGLAVSQGQAAVHDLEEPRLRVHRRAWRLPRHRLRTLCLDQI
ncbi:MAG: hypothetical protein HC904_11650, partial [Blastochloris sp.]|nr:hypothetical protein [Blastochloris sp.]